MVFRMIPCVLCVCLLLTFAAAPAAATSCVDGTPDNCAPSGPMICVFISPSIIECDTDRTGGANSVTAYGIFDPATTLYEFFGTDTDGNNFCCRMNSPGVHLIQFYGSNHADTLQLFYTAGGSRWDMAPGATPVEVQVYDRDDDDFIFGGDTDVLGYEENLHGEMGDDHLSGHLGGDDLYGGPGQDRIFGGMGSDYAHGGGDNDIIEGGPGDDVLYGGHGHDFIRGRGGDDLLMGGEGDDSLRGFDGNDILVGESGSDFIEGGNGNDILCGGTEGETFPTVPDHLYGNAGNDQLWGMTAGRAGTFNDGDAGTGTDSCGDPSLYASCEATLFTPPWSCP